MLLRNKLIFYAKLRLSEVFPLRYPVLNFVHRYGTISRQLFLPMPVMDIV